MHVQLNISQFTVYLAVFSSETVEMAFSISPLSPELHSSNCSSSSTSSVTSASASLSIVCCWLSWSDFEPLNIFWKCDSASANDERDAFGWEGCVTEVFGLELLPEITLLNHMSKTVMNYIMNQGLFLVKS